MIEQGKVTSANRLTIPTKIAKELNVQKGDFYQAESVGTDRILFTFIHLQSHKKGGEETK